MDLFKAEIGCESGLGGTDVSLAIVLYIDGSYCSVTVYNYCSRPGWLVAVTVDTDLACLAGPAQDRRIGGPAARPPACRSQRLGCWPEPGVELTWKYASSVVPSQTGGFVIKSDAAGPLQR